MRSQFDLYPPERSPQGQMHLVIAGLRTVDMRSRLPIGAVCPNAEMYEELSAILVSVVAFCVNRLHSTSWVFIYL